MMIRYQYSVVLTINNTYITVVAISYSFEKLFLHVLHNIFESGFFVKLKLGRIYRAFSSTNNIYKKYSSLVVCFLTTCMRRPSYGLESSFLLLITVSAIQDMKQMTADVNRRAADR